ncbi:tRNA-dihydrouridine synthase family protein [Ruficoccus sp. ZRK36]|uniref:tRNA dihydrouridine synthase n=1 Tax=Ruficoccus sp. ZRK36 TaxID=2866311 RepID=UPI001C730BE9|nr:tRNA-dihydrouridine synthase family protein [Ruficoccus sp. ZRK36]QYY34437.1 tRNA-dihydrouridine synthase family protein [Ruficoccus sp. ZRK36]
MPDNLPWFAGGAFPLYLAPMARYTDFGFRQLCKEQGADVMVTEFVQADGLLRGGPQAWRAVDFTEGQRPMGVQLFGSNPETMAEAARRVWEKVRPDFIDINYGCPACKVIDQNAGSSLLRDLDRLGAVAEAVVKALPECPVTAKIRIGWDHKSIVAMEVGKILTDVGIRALAVHGRTKEQGYGGHADWDVIEQVARELPIPVIGNGDVRDWHFVARMRRESAVSGLMIGRAALGYPWIFNVIKQTLATGEAPEPPTVRERWATVFRYLDLLLKGPYKAKPADDIAWMRAKVKSLTKDMAGSRKLRPAIDRVKSLDELRALSQEHLAEYGEPPGYSCWG